MKTKAVTATILAGLSMVSGAAFAQTGSVGATYARVEGDNSETDVYGLDGEVIFGATDAWGFIVEGDFTESDSVDGTETVQAHIINRSSNSAWGVFLGAADGENGVGILGGVEYAQFLDGSTLALSLNYGTDSEIDVDAYGVNGAYRIFAGDNLRFDVGASAGRVDSNLGQAEVYSAGVAFEYRFDGSPYSIGAGYTRVDSDGAEADVFGLTLRFNFGDTTLKAADRSGRTFTGLGSAFQAF